MEKTCNGIEKFNILLFRNEEIISLLSIILKPTVVKSLNEFFTLTL